MGPHNCTSGAGDDTSGSGGGSGGGGGGGGAMESDCPVCKDFLFTSDTPVKCLPCGHFMHTAGTPYKFANPVDP
jgi:zinc finger-like protein